MWQAANVLRVKHVSHHPFVHAYLHIQNILQHAISQTISACVESSWMIFSWKALSFRYDLEHTISDILFTSNMHL